LRNSDMKTVAAIIIVVGVTLWAIGGLDWRRRDEPKRGFCFSCGGVTWRCPVPNGSEVVCNGCGKVWGFKPTSGAVVKKTNKLLRAAGCKPGHPPKGKR
jgi:hypothetical protein